ncbi:uncharacterized protein FOMMEDRAFT_139781 [Fomitiporia mediterranea MF3/22]|uniref:uncharacterized protein n=1 Tax=Fomitiporia mediterranea (strain MF3/22) TaxID=694068 RepID=UPI000440763F|nr:uncharacterized protein FOMMEDRAFT_139781 [Fomitiporia mediterranea MF3/22]EJD03524.1 hypothetical protein FOMMEDRAFT_139781 [Fomitiporia mediterranea MF3/22]
MVFLLPLQLRCGVLWPSTFTPLDGSNSFLAWRRITRYRMFQDRENTSAFLNIHILNSMSTMKFVVLP